MSWTPHHELSAPVTLACAVSLLSFHLTYLRAQEADYSFDPSGNLVSAITNSAFAPMITAQPQNKLLQPGAPVSLSVAATGFGLAYQWLSNGVPIAGATNDTLLLPGLSGGNFGSYSVIISNTSGVVTSTPAAIWLDSNGNGIPDWYESLYFGNLNQPGDGDYDGDGVSNLDEYLEGTDPTDPTSYHPRLHIQSLHGQVIVSPMLPFYTMGQTVELTALPDPGQTFLGWTGSVTAAKPSISLVMDSHKTVIATFGLPLPVALDNTNIQWTTGGDSPWFGQTGVSYDGLGAAQSGPIFLGQQSWVRGNVVLTQDMQLSFWWSVSSAPQSGVLQFGVDNSGYYASISGVGGGWQNIQRVVPAGARTLSWVYTVQYQGLGLLTSGVAFSDCGWVDQVSITPLAPVITAQPQSQAAFYGSSVLFSAGITGAQPLGYQWFFNSNVLANATNSSLLITGVSHMNQGFYSLLATNAYGSVQSTNAFLTVQVPQRLTTPSLLPGGSFTLNSGYADGWPISSSELSSFQAQVSSNFIDWTPLANALSLSNGVLLLQDPGATNQRARFYRIMQN